MERQTFKRLAYGFSALVMALSAVSFVPAGNTYATDATCVGAVSESGVQTSNVTIVPNATSCVVTATANYNIKTMQLTGDLANLNEADYTMAKSGKTMTFTLTQSGIDAVKAAGTLSGGITVTRGSADVEVSFEMSFTCADLEVSAEETLEAYVSGDAVTINPTFNNTEYTGDVANVVFAVTSEDENVIINDNNITIKGGEDGEPYFGEDRDVDLVVTATDTTNNITSEAFVTKLVIKHYEEMVVTSESTSLDIAEDAEVTEAVFGVVAGEGTTTQIEADDFVVEPTYDEESNGYIYTLTAKEDTGAGVYPVTLKQQVETVADGTVTISTIEKTVNVYDTTEVTEAVNVMNEEATIVSDAGQWAGSTNADEEVLAVESESVVDGKYTLAVRGLETGLGAVTLFDSAEEPAFAKTINFVVYKAESEAVVKVGENVTLGSLIDLPLGYEYNATVTAGGESVTLTNDKVIGTARGEATIAYDITDGSTTVGAGTLTVNVYDADEAAELEDEYYVAMEVEDAAEVINYAPMNDNSEVDYAVEGSELEISTISMVPGDYTVTVTETLAGEVINTDTTLVRVYGTDLPDSINVFEEGGVDAEVVSNLVSIALDDINTQKITVTLDEKGYTVDAPKGSAGSYTASFTKTIQAGPDANNVVEVPGEVTINVYKPLTVTFENDTIDTAEGSTDTAATFEMEADERVIVVVSEDAADEADEIFDIDSENGIITLKEGVEVEDGRYGIVFTSFNEDGEVLNTEEYYVTVIDSSAVYTETAWASDEEAELLIDEEEAGTVSLGFTADEKSFNVVTVSGEEEGLGVEVNGAEVVVTADETVTPGVYTVTLSSYKADGETLVNEITRDVTVRKTVDGGLSVVTAGDTVKIEVPEGYTLKISTFNDEEENSYSDEETAEFFTVEKGDGYYLVTADAEAVSGLAVLGFESEDGYTTVLYGITIVSADTENVIVMDSVTGLTAEEAELVDPEGYAAIVDAVEAAGYDTEKLAFYDVDMLIYDEDGEVIGQLNEIGSEVAVIIDVSELGEAAEGYERNYVVFFYHNGEVYEITDVTDNGDGTISFYTDKFSTYAVSYEDVKAAKEEATKKAPDTGAVTGENASAVVSAASIAASVVAALTLAGAVVIAKRK